MYSVHINGYKEDTWPFIPLLELIKELSEMSFADARAIADRIWARQTAEITFMDRSIADDFIKRADILGVNCVLLPDLEQ